MQINDFKYVPVLRYRQEERKAILSTAISNKMLPLIEIVTEKLRSNSRDDIITSFVNDFGQFNTCIMLDFPLYLTLTNQTKSAVRNFINPIKVNPASRVNLFLNQQLLSLSHIIPVVTYDPTVPYQPGQVTHQEQLLRPHYKVLAFRIFPNHLTQITQEMSSVIKDGDIVIFDIDEASHYHPSIRSNYPIVQAINPNVNYKTVLLRSAIPRDLTNVGLANGQIVQEADNSLKTDYVNFGFNAFGDYAGVKKDNLTDGGIISPGYLMYSWNSNCYYGFNGILKQAHTFETMVVPTIINSQVWNEYNNTHKQSCMGCSAIIQISNGTKSGNSQPEWKGFAIGHYLYTMEEFL
ncbi:hypothetical protein NSS60_01985 [Anoxybacillus sp. FSL W8-0382]|uniref:beta family protein n=1 Tax=Anoxybacillus sp. FSL W8-0382 TaxID=2954700 RepID=UPI0030F9525E